MGYSVTPLIPKRQRTRSEIKAEIERLEKRTTGSIQEQVGAITALRWILCEEGYDDDHIHV